MNIQRPTGIASAYDALRPIIVRERGVGLRIPCWKALVEKGWSWLPVNTLQGHFTNSAAEWMWWSDTLAVLRACVACCARNKSFTPRVWHVTWSPDTGSGGSSRGAYTVSVHSYAQSAHAEATTSALPMWMDATAREHKWTDAEHDMLERVCACVPTWTQHDAAAWRPTWNDLCITHPCTPEAQMAVDDVGDVEGAERAWGHTGIHCVVMTTPHVRAMHVLDVHTGVPLWKPGRFRRVVHRWVHNLLRTPAQLQDMLRQRGWIRPPWEHHGPVCEWRAMMPAVSMSVKHMTRPREHHVVMYPPSTERRPAHDGGTTAPLSSDADET